MLDPAYCPRSTAVPFFSKVLLRRVMVAVAGPNCGKMWTKMPELAPWM